MLQDELNKFSAYKKAHSPFLKLEDGESCTVNDLKSAEMIIKSAFGKVEPYLSCVLEVETSDGIFEKIFDNKSEKFKNELVKNNISIGSKFVLTRTGQNTKTLYTISAVDNSGVRQSDQSTAPVAPTPAPVQQTLTQAPSAVAAALAGVQK